MTLKTARGEIGFSRRSGLLPSQPCFTSDANIKLHISCQRSRHGGGDDFCQGVVRTVCMGP